MSSLEVITLCAFAASYGATIFSAVAADIADRREGYWHGSASNWRVIALFNILSVGACSLALYSWSAS